MIHDGSSRGGADGRGCKARERSIPEATRSEAAGLNQYVEESDRAQRRRHARIRCRSRSFMNNAG